MSMSVIQRYALLSTSLFFFAGFALQAEEDLKPEPPAPIEFPADATAEQKAQIIVDEGEKRAEGFKDMIATAKMVIRNSKGQEASRELDIQVMEVDNGGKGLTVVKAPKDVRGIALLTRSWDDKDDDQWLYLPAVKRVKRIASSNKNGAFMGSEFTYEDMSGQPPEKYTYTLLREEDYQGIPCFVMERRPKDLDSTSYSKTIAWIDKVWLRGFKVDYYDKRDNLVKTLEISGYEHYDDEWWRAETFTMTNHNNGGVTTLVWSDIKFDNQLSDKDFDVNSLKRAR